MGSLPQEILRVIAYRYPLGYKSLYDYLYSKSGRLDKNSLSATLSRMRQRGLLNLNNSKWSITPEGEELLQRRDSIKKFQPPFRTAVRGPKRLIVIFDIPEKKKRYREWLRAELVTFGFDLIQKSVWYGPALPQDFIEYLDSNGLLKHIRFFRVTEKDLI